MRQIAVSRLAAARLYEVQPGDPVIFAAVVVLLLAVSLLSAGLPAAHAARTPPGEALGGAA